MLAHTAYGKSKVRLVQVARHGDRHDLRDLTVAIQFEGDYDKSYTAGDNSGVLPTDTMKNTVYALAGRGPIDGPEPFAPRSSCRHFLDRNARLGRVRVEITEHGVGPHRATAPANTARPSSARAPARVRPRPRRIASRPSSSAGLADLVILKSSRSAFSGYMRDEYTTLPETRDRILATSLSATWRYREGEIAFGPAWWAVRGTLLETFAAHESESVQHTHVRDGAGRHGRLRAKSRGSISSCRTGIIFPST